MKTFLLVLLCLIAAIWIGAVLALLLKLRTPPRSRSAPAAVGSYMPRPGRRA